MDGAGTVLLLIASGILMMSGSSVLFESSYYTEFSKSKGKNVENRDINAIRYMISKSLFNGFSEEQLIEVLGTSESEFDTPGKGTLRYEIQLWNQELGVDFIDGEADALTLVCRE